MVNAIRDFLGLQFDGKRDGDAPSPETCELAGNPVSTAFGKDSNGIVFVNSPCQKDCSNSTGVAHYILKGFFQPALFSFFRNKGDFLKLISSLTQHC